MSYRYLASLAALATLLIGCPGDASPSLRTPSTDGAGPSVPPGGPAATDPEAPSGQTETARLPEDGGGDIALGVYDCQINITFSYDTVEILAGSRYAPTSSAAGVFSYDPNTGLLRFETGGWAGVFTHAEYYAAGAQGVGQGPQLWAYFVDDSYGDGIVTCYGPDGSAP